MPRWLASQTGNANSLRTADTHTATAKSGIVGRFCETPNGLASDTDALQGDACQNLKRLRDILRNIELRCAFDVSRTGCVATGLI